MLLRIVKRDLQRNKIITFGLFVFIMLSALLVASASQVIIELSGSLNQLLIKSKAPSFRADARRTNRQLSNRELYSR